MSRGVSIILAHPDPASFNHAIALTAACALEREGHDVRYHDRYRERSDPLLASADIARDVDLPPDIARHCAEIAEADGIVIVHPN